MFFYCLTFFSSFKVFFLPMNEKSIFLLWRLIWRIILLFRRFLVSKGTKQGIQIRYHINLKSKNNQSFNIATNIKQHEWFFQIKRSPPCHHRLKHHSYQVRCVHQIRIALRQNYHSSLVNHATSWLVGTRSRINSSECSEWNWADSVKIDWIRVFHKLNQNYWNH